MRARTEIAHGRDRVPPPVATRVVKIEVTEPMPDYSEGSIEGAFKKAVEISVEGAAAMGLSWVRLDEAKILKRRVMVRMIATDEELEETKWSSTGP